MCPRVYSEIEKGNEAFLEGAKQQPRSYSIWLAWGHQLQLLSINIWTEAPERAKDLISKSLDKFIMVRVRRGCG